MTAFNPKKNDKLLSEIIKFALSRVETKSGMFSGMALLIETDSRGQFDTLTIRVANGKAKNPPGKTKILKARQNA